LQKLEDAVSQLLRSGASPANQSQGDKPLQGNAIQSPAMPSVTVQGFSERNENVTRTHKILHSQGSQGNYVDSSHWLSILNDIKEVREQLSLSSAQVEEQPDITKDEDVDLVLGPVPMPNKVDMIKSLPARSVCDSLLSQYFNAQFMSLRKLL
jgi:hypothetical protein